MLYENEYADRPLQGHYDGHIIDPSILGRLYI
jgi:hypothetical protein